MNGPTPDPRPLETPEERDLSLSVPFSDNIAHTPEHNPQSADPQVESTTDLNLASMPSKQEYQAFSSGKSIREAAKALTMAAKVLSNSNSLEENLHTMNFHSKRLVFTLALGTAVSTTAIAAVAGYAGMIHPSPMVTFAVSFFGGAYLSHFITKNTIRDMLPAKLIKPVYKAIDVTLSDSDYPGKKVFNDQLPTTTLFHLVLNGLIESGVIRNLNEEQKDNLLAAAIQVESREGKYWLEYAVVQGRSDDPYLSLLQPLTDFIKARNEIIAEAAKFFINPSHYPFPNADMLVAVMQDSYVTFHDRFIETHRHLQQTQ